VGKQTGEKAIRVDQGVQNGIEKLVRRSLNRRVFIEDSGEAIFRLLKILSLLNKLPCIGAGIERASLKIIK
jgi:hypothetical protein